MTLALVDVPLRLNKGMAMMGTLTHSTVVTPELEGIAKMRTEALQVNLLPEIPSVLRWLQLFYPHVKTEVVDATVTFRSDGEATGLPADDYCLLAARIDCSAANALPGAPPADQPELVLKPYDLAADAAPEPHTRQMIY